MHSSQSLDEVKRIVLSMLGGRRVRVLLFGSHARGEAGAHSDIDVGVLADEHLEADLLPRIREALEEAPIPQSVDVVDLSRADPELCRRALEEGIPWL